MPQVGTVFDRLLLLAQAQESSKRAEEYFAKRDEARQEAKSKIEDIDGEIREMLAEIEEKKSKADDLAAEFKHLYQESQDAYAEGDGETAKMLSEEGHDVQDECEALNREVTGLYEKLKALNRKKKSLLEKADYWHNLAMTEIEKAKSLRQQANELILLPQIALKGIPQEFQNAIIDTLKSLPPHHISDKVIERISYSGEYKLGSSGNPIQAQLVSPKTGGRLYIKINKQTPEGKWVNINRIKYAVAHEVGHVVYREILTDRQKANWSSSFNHPKGPEESFAESYRYYYLNREELSKDFPLVKIFFDHLNLE
uniref:DUF1771 domain-containing protein n=1 Tax=candidate division CPR3 bacterium TaxID=2268181 RepID=A0A7V3JAA3_UNCC3